MLFVYSRDAKPKRSYSSVIRQPIGYYVARFAFLLTVSLRICLGNFLVDVILKRKSDSESKLSIA